MLNQTACSVVNPDFSKGSNAFGSEFSAENCSLSTAAKSSECSARMSFEAWPTERTQGRSASRTLVPKVLNATAPQVKPFLRTADQMDLTKTQEHPVGNPGATRLQICARAPSVPNNASLSHLPVPRPRVPRSFICPLSGKVMRDPVTPVPLLPPLAVLLPQGLSNPPQGAVTSASTPSGLRRQQIQLPNAESTASLAQLSLPHGTSGWYERTAIACWLVTQSRPQPHLQLVANVSLRKSIQEWLHQHGLDFEAADELLVLERGEQFRLGAEGEQRDATLQAGTCCDQLDPDGRVVDSDSLTARAPCAPPPVTSMASPAPVLVAMDGQAARSPAFTFTNTTATATTCAPVAATGLHIQEVVSQGGAAASGTAPMRATTTAIASAAMSMAAAAEVGCLGATGSEFAANSAAAPVTGTTWAWAPSRSYTLLSNSVSSSWGSGGFGGSISWHRWNSNGAAAAAATGISSSSVLGQGLVPRGGSTHVISSTSVDVSPLTTGGNAMMGEAVPAMSSQVPQPAVAAAAEMGIGWGPSGADVWHGKQADIPLAIWSHSATAQHLVGASVPTLSAVNSPPGVSGTGPRLAHASSAAAPGSEAPAQLGTMAATSTVGADTGIGAAAAVVSSTGPQLAVKAPVRLGSGGDGRGGGGGGWYLPLQGAPLYQQHALPRQQPGSTAGTPAAAAPGTTAAARVGSSLHTVEGAWGEDSRHLYHRSASAPLSLFPPHVQVALHHHQPPSTRLRVPASSSPPQHQHQHQPLHRLSRERSAVASSVPELTGSTRVARGGSAAGGDWPAAYGVVTASTAMKGPQPQPQQPATTACSPGWRKSQQLPKPTQSIHQKQQHEPLQSQPTEHQHFDELADNQCVSRHLRLRKPASTTSLQMLAQSQGLNQQQPEALQQRQHWIHQNPQLQQVPPVGYDEFQAMQDQVQRVPVYERGDCAGTSPERMLLLHMDAVQGAGNEGKPLWSRLWSGGSGKIGGRDSRLPSRVIGRPSNNGGNGLLTGCINPRDTDGDGAGPPSSDSEGMVTARETSCSSSDGGRSKEDRGKDRDGGVKGDGDEGCGSRSSEAGQGQKLRVTGFRKVASSGSFCRLEAEIRANMRRALSVCWQHSREANVGVAAAATAAATTGSQGVGSGGGGSSNSWWYRTADRNCFDVLCDEAKSPALHKQQLPEHCYVGEHGRTWKKDGSDEESDGGKCDDGYGGSPSPSRLLLQRQPPPMPLELPLELPLPLNWLTAHQLAECGLSPRDEVQAAQRQRQRVWRWLRGVPPPACRDLLTLLRCTPSTLPSKSTPSLGFGCASRKRAGMVPPLRCVPVGSRLQQQITALTVLPPPPGPPPLAYNLLECVEETLNQNTARDAPEGHGSVSAVDALAALPLTPPRGPFAVLVTRDRPGHVVIEELLPARKSSSAVLVAPPLESYPGGTSQSAHGDTGGRCWMVPAVRGRVTAVAACPRGGSVAVGTSAGLVFIWRCFTGEDLRALQDLTEMDDREQAPAVPTASGEALEGMEARSRLAGSGTTGTGFLQECRQSFEVAAAAAVGPAAAAAAAPPPPFPTSPLPLEWQLCGRLGWREDVLHGFHMEDRADADAGDANGSRICSPGARQDEKLGVAGDRSVTALTYDGTGVMLFAACRGVVAGWKLRQFERPERFPTVATAAFLVLRPEDYGYLDCSTDSAASGASWFGRRGSYGGNTPRFGIPAGGSYSDRHQVDEALGVITDAATSTAGYCSPFDANFKNYGPGQGESGGGGHRRRARSSETPLKVALTLSCPAQSSLGLAVSAPASTTEGSAVSAGSPPATATCCGVSTGIAPLSPPRVIPATSLLSPLQIPTSAAAIPGVTTPTTTAAAATIDAIPSPSLGSYCPLLPDTAPVLDSAAVLPFAHSAAAPTVDAVPSPTELRGTSGPNAFFYALSPCRPTVCSLASSPSGAHLALALSDGAVYLAQHVDSSCRTVCIRLLPPGPQPALATRGQTLPGAATQMAFSGDERRLLVLALGLVSVRSQQQQQQLQSRTRTCSSRDSGFGAVGGSVAAGSGGKEHTDSLVVQYSLHCFPLTQEALPESEMEGEEEADVELGLEGDYAVKAGTGTWAAVDAARRRGGSGPGSAVGIKTRCHGTRVYVSLDTNDDGDPWVGDEAVDGSEGPCHQDVRLVASWGDGEDEDIDEQQLETEEEEEEEEERGDDVLDGQVDGHDDMEEEEANAAAVAAALLATSASVMQAEQQQLLQLQSPLQTGSLEGWLEPQLGSCLHNPNKTGFVRQRCIASSSRDVSCRAGGGNGERCRRRLRQSQGRQSRCGGLCTAGTGDGAGGGVGLGDPWGDGGGSSGHGSGGGGGGVGGSSKSSGSCYGEIVLGGLAAFPENWGPRLTNLVVGPDGKSALLLDRNRPWEHCPSHSNPQGPGQHQHQQQVPLREGPQHQPQLVFIDLVTGKARTVPLELRPCDQPPSSTGGGGEGGRRCCNGTHIGSATISATVNTGGVQHHHHHHHQRCHRCLFHLGCSCMALLPGGRELLVGGDCGLLRWTFGTGWQDPPPPRASL